ncbi:hypothetical protein LshimejAT787_0110680 [Lyophyllum shimeji]|uniref:Uncharacterized protein n=1 Tax=Lyophyllum shimeji TaxID=47721 RepID=A0A9P3PEU5_LYOSH|nr:hypothetical protein LshimejAT787_0110680 [Lyophyllum shimeji]
MSSSEYLDIEQDSSAPNGQDGLPTYDDLAAQHGPNSRFGRWRGWIEKRAAERYLDVSPEELARRRQRGWGNENFGTRTGSQTIPTVDITSTASPPSLSALHIQTENLHVNPTSPDPQTPSPPLPPLPFLSKRLPPTHLKITQFGSRFLPHTTSPIRCLLPLESDRLLLIGHDEGLSVLDLFPQEWSEDGSIAVKGPDEAQARLIWQGESVLQMSLLEVENTGEGTPQGVVLVLVGPEGDSSCAKDADAMRTLRMYNLASLTSLAKWAVAQKGARPLDLHRPSNWQVQQSPSKRSRPQSSSLARGLKSLIDHPNGGSHAQGPSGSSYDKMLTSPSSATSSTRSTHVSERLAPNRKASDDSGWDVVDDLPLRWATDYVPLATNGSRLLNSSVISYALWSDDSRKGRGGRLLAIATKNNILLYETPKGERAFRFVKEFYTPLQPRNITFFQQSVYDVGRSASDVGTPRHYQPRKRSESASTLRAGVGSLRASTSTSILNYGTHLSLFVIFDKKAGWIRLADSAVGEMELYDVSGGLHQRASDTSGHSSLLKSRMSFEIQHHMPKWIPPTRCTLPVPNRPGVTRDIHLMTRGTATHIVPCPLPVDQSSYTPLFAATWRSAPTSVSTRICLPSGESGYSPPFLQLIALGGEYGLEVQEIPLSFVAKGKGKGRAYPSEEPVRAEEDLGGDSGLLCTGGHWDQSHHLFHRQHLSRSYSASSAVSASSFTSMESEDLMEKMKKEQGIYAWCRKGLEDWRVFWIGGPLTGDVEDDGDDPDR